jgi:ethanolamine utilization protein EutA
MHETDFDHDHEELYARSQELEGLEQFTLLSVGIDIGSSTTNLLFSRLRLRRQAGSFSTRFEVAEREVLWSSPILLTPYAAAERIDFDKIRGFIEGCYAAADISPDQVDSGAVVITGEALKKENAEQIAGYFARSGGKFVCASAGPLHEALLAAHGSGAVQFSKVSRSNVLNIDIGGGTTKLTLVRNGEIQHSASVNIGARLIALDANRVVSRLEEAGALFARMAGTPQALGSVLSEAAEEVIAGLMAETLIAVFEPDRDGGLLSQLWVTPPFRPDLRAVDYIVYSGGVGEYVYGYSTASFGDLGPVLGTALRRYNGRLAAGMLIEPAQTIRATVIGASSYALQVSGSTNHCDAAGLFPLFNLKVIPVKFRPDGSFPKALEQALRKFDLGSFVPGMMISIDIEGDIDYAVLQTIASSLADLAAADPATPLIVNVEQDVSRSLGNILRQDFSLANPLLAIDGIQVGDLDYVDIGSPMTSGGAFPVTVKSLLFSARKPS